MAALEERALPAPGLLESPFWSAAAQRKLVIQRCDDCGTYLHPPDVVCGVCASERLEYREVSGKGVLYSFTVFHNAEKQPPPVIAVVELAEQEGLWLVTELTQAQALEELRIGSPMHVEFESVTDEVTLPRFVLD